MDFAVPLPRPQLPQSYHGGSSVRKGSLITPFLAFALPVPTAHLPRMTPRLRSLHLHDDALQCLRNSGRSRHHRLLSTSGSATGSEGRSPELIASRLSPMCFQKSSLSLFRFSRDSIRFSSCAIFSWICSSDCISVLRDVINARPFDIYGALGKHPFRSIMAHHQ